MTDKPLDLDALELVAVECGIHQPKVLALIAELRAARAKVKRVRDLCNHDTALGNSRTLQRYSIVEVLAALDGDEVQP